MKQKLTFTDVYKNSFANKHEIQRKHYLHILLRALNFTATEVKDMLKLDYNIIEYEQGATFRWVHDYIKPAIKDFFLENFNKYGFKIDESDEASDVVEENEENKKSVYSGGDFLTKDEIYENLTSLYRRIYNNTKLPKEDVKSLLDIIKRIQDDFGLFDLEEIAQKKFYSHFYEVFRALNAICPKCKREIDLIRGAKIQCRHCKNWIDTRETKEDVEKGREFTAGEHGKNNMKQKGGEPCIIYYDNHIHDKRDE